MEEQENSQMVGLAIAVILGIIALRAMAATAGVGLHKGVQTAEIVGDWHKLSTELRTGQNCIDNETVNALAESRQAVMLLGDQLDILKSR